MNCCTANGECKQGPGCPARESTSSPSEPVVPITALPYADVNPDDPDYDWPHDPAYRYTVWIVCALSACMTLGTAAYLYHAFWS